MKEDNSNEARLKYLGQDRSDIMPRDVETNGGRTNEDKEGRKLFSWREEVGSDVHGRGGWRRRCVGGCFS